MPVWQVSAVQAEDTAGLGAPCAPVPRTRVRVRPGSTAPPAALLNPEHTHLEHQHRQAARSDPQLSPGHSYKMPRLPSDEALATSFPADKLVLSTPKG